MRSIKKFESRKNKLSRRAFLGGAATAAAFTIVPRHVLGGPGHIPPSEKLNVAGIGIGGQGRSNTRIVGTTENIVALCDVDDKHSAKTYEFFPDVPKYKDYRKMLEKQKDIDAVIIATPDHSHAVITMAAIQAGKHVYTQKPLTHSIYEARKITEAARNSKVITQMGNQGHSGEGVRLVCEWIWDGAIGKVRKVEAWTNRPLWKQGMDRPTETPPMPETLDWDLWLGPAKYRPYHPAYVPWSWRAWWDFGTGVMGDMGCHILDPVAWALKLKYPVSVEASSTGVNSETAPKASIIHYKFPARGEMPEVTISWYDGGLMPERPEELEPGRKMGNEEGGVLFTGDKGKLMCGCYAASPRLIPEEKMRAYKRPPKTIERVDIRHELDWVRACKTGKPACSNFEVAGPLTEMVLLGNLALRTGEKLSWDGSNMKVTNIDEANRYVRDEYRQGWSL